VGKWTAGGHVAARIGPVSMLAARTWDTATARCREQLPMSYLVAVGPASSSPPGWSLRQIGRLDYRIGDSA
jgi:hypothetical protein